MPRSLEKAARFVAYPVVRWLADRIDRFRPRLRPFDGRLPPPDRVTIETTRYCNLSCRMCLPYLAGITVTGPHMALEKFRKYAEEVFPFVTRFQPSVSGEPTMTKDFVEMLAIARKYGVKMEITTNGTLLTPKVVDALLPVLRRITLSADGATAATFEAIREGARFERVMTNLRNLMDRVAALPKPERPVVGLGCTIMERNIRELPAMIEMAHAYGLDFVCASHMMPASDEMRHQSLFHFQDLARSCIQEAAALARRHGVHFKVPPLDRIIAETAAKTSAGRALARSDGAVPGLDQWIIVAPEHDEPASAAPTGPEGAAIAEQRQAGREGASYPARHERARFPKQQDPIWVCDFLWNESYIHIEGDVRPCCVEGPPVLGSLERDHFDKIWNDDLYRAMRQRLVVRDPVAVCKGCQFIREVKDPKQTDAWLQGRSIPRGSELIPLPPSLAPGTRPAARDAPAPSEKEAVETVAEAPSAKSRP